MRLYEVDQTRRPVKSLVVEKAKSAVHHERTVETKLDVRQLVFNVKRQYVKFYFFSILRLRTGPVAKPTAHPFYRVEYTPEAASTQRKPRFFLIAGFFFSVPNIYTFSA